MHAVHARVKYQENVLKEYKKHAENGTFPKRLKSTKSYPKMQSPEAQKRVNEAYHQVEYGGLLVMDDLMTEGGDDKEVLDPFTKHSRHRNITVIYLCQDVFGEPLEEDEEPENSDDEDNDDEGEDEDKDDGDDDDDDNNVSVNPWSELKQEVKDDMKTTLAEQEEEQEKEGASENDKSLLPLARRKLRRLYLHRLKWYNCIKQDKIHRQVIHTARRLMNEDGMD
ncbi:hypothetical protein AWC38_SpisGene23135 [Stylophora pistillata]|uniref:Uncharacterized protein n=1 Tax=Stylophora pistillata TaxID=50429 RepID=A0A2B4R7N2_STYPI|nr:hypothetical protein AWC38_SpisGene23135 [Stylophora pistillata]